MITLYWASLLKLINFNLGHMQTQLNHIKQYTVWYPIFSILPPLNAFEYSAVWHIMDVMVKKVYFGPTHNLFIYLLRAKSNSLWANFMKWNIEVFGQFHFLVSVNDSRIEWFCFLKFTFSLALYSFVVMSIKKNSEN